MIASAAPSEGVALRAAMAQAQATLSKQKLAAASAQVPVVTATLRSAVQPLSFRLVSL